MNTGFIKLWRQLWDNPYMQKPSYLAVWIWLITHVEHGMRNDGNTWRKARQDELREVLFQGKRIRLQPGQLTAGAYQIASGCGVPRGTVERILKLFKNEEQIEVVSDMQCSLITVKNWSTYQISEERNEERLRNDRGTSEDYKKNDKNEKNDNNVTVLSETTTQLAAELSTHIRNTNPAYAAKHTRDDPALVGKWAAELDKLIRIDKATEEQICFVMTWLFTSEDRDALFWRKNIQSGATLRKQWQRLVGSVKFSAEHQKKNGYLFIS